MKMPKTIKIGAQTISVHSEDPEIMDTTYGRYIPAKNKIEISKDLEKQQEALTLLHEVLHACFSDAGLVTKFNKDDEEVIVRALEGRIGALIKDNKKFIQYIQESLDA